MRFAQLLEHETDRARVSARLDEVRPAERGVEVVKRNVVRQIRDGKPQGDVRIVMLKEIVGAKTEIEYMPGRNARWIVVVICCALGRYI